MAKRGSWKSLALGAAVGFAVMRLNRLRRRINFANRRVVVAGGSRGLGLALARRLVKEGARVAILARDPQELNRAEASLRKLRGDTQVLVRVCDVSHQSEVSEVVAHVVEAWGGVDVVLNVAGVIQVGPWEHMSTRDFEEALDVHLWGPLNMIRAVVPHMRANGFGRIVNITSVGGAVAVPHMLPYATSKAALIGLSGGIQAELSRHGVRVTTVVPGLMRTGSHVNARFKGQHSREFAWFAGADAMPVLSLSAERAARQILEACRHGDFHVAVGWPARLAEIVSALAPNFTARALATVNRVMPDTDGEEGDEAQPGWRARAKPSSRVTYLADKEIEPHNERSRRH